MTPALPPDLARKLGLLAEAHEMRRAVHTNMWVRLVIGLTCILVGSLLFVATAIVAWQSLMAPAS